MDILMGAQEPICQHGIFYLAMAHAQAPFGPPNQIRCLTHVFHTPGNNGIYITTADHLLRQGYCPQARGTGLIQSIRTNRYR